MKQSDRIQQDIFAIQEKRQKYAELKREIDDALCKNDAMLPMGSSKLFDWNGKRDELNGPEYAYVPEYRQKQEELFEPAKRYLKCLEEASGNLSKLSEKIQEQIDYLDSDLTYANNLYQNAVDAEQEESGD